MRIITYKAIDQYSGLYPDVKLALDEWYIKSEQSEWNCFIGTHSEYDKIKDCSKI
ncbi:MAG: hypothetical protein LBH58_09275 [Tannerellaceae bacterium]|jgi:mRNA-degrading endonuclease HigB of HigAB toxin-antitoxin module|nr:hypothetical protein [Tannerellaceae bacterium]